VCVCVCVLMRCRRVLGQTHQVQVEGRLARFRRHGPHPTTSAVQRRRLQNEDEAGNTQHRLTPSLVTVDVHRFWPQQHHNASTYVSSVRLNYDSRNFKITPFIFDLSFMRSYIWRHVTHAVANCHYSKLSLMRPNYRQRKWHG